MNPVEFNAVWKKFRLGEKFYSLRDFIPNLVKGAFRPAAPADEAVTEKEFWALKDVNFQVKKGEVLGIIGPNGAGKSTILKLLSKLMLPTRGTMNIRGKFSALIEVTAGFHPEFTGRENIYFNGAVMGMKRREIDQKFDQIVDFSGVRDFIDTPVKRYSSGMYARLGFSVAAHIDPDVMLVDEVLAVGDMNFQAKCAQKMRDLLKNGTTIVLVSHNIPLVQTLCNRVILLKKGEVVKEGLPGEVVPAYQNLVFEERENELKSQIKKQSHRLDIVDASKLEIRDVTFHADGAVVKDQFMTDAAVSLDISFHSREGLDNPIIALNIIRADGVNCCAVNTRDAKVAIPRLSGEGRITVDLGRLRLIPGIYHLEVSVWDREMIHAYAIRKKDVFRVNSLTPFLNNGGVFWPETRWDLG